MSSKLRALRTGLAGLLVAAFLVALLAGLAALAWAAPEQSASASNGETIFSSQCAACHTIGGGKRVGPDLKGVTSLRPATWLAQWIANPAALISAGDPTATALVKQFNGVVMPTLGLTPSQVQDVIAYLASQSGATTTGTPQATPAGTPPALPPGTALRGKQLFLGSAHLQNAGPPCMGCHSVNQAGVFGGGAVGLNLTNAYTKFGAAGLAGILASPPFPVMQPVFAAHPLTPQEQANLLAYLQTTPNQPTSNLMWLYLIIGVVGLVGVYIVAAFIWRHRLEGVRRPLVERTRRRQS